MKRLLPFVALTLALAETVVVLLSWLLSAAFPATGLRSLLSSEGLRWFFGHYADMMATPLLVWLLLLAMAGGCLRQSGLLEVHRPLSHRQQRGLWAAGLTMAVCLLVMLLLTLVPHAVLLSAVGGLFPSAFSASLIPSTAFTLLLVSLTYGLMSGSYRTLQSAYDSLLYGIRAASSVLLFYILLIQFYYSLLFFLGQNPNF